MRWNRFFKTLSLLVFSLFLLGAGLDATLDRLESSPSKSQLVIYDSELRMSGQFTGTLPELARADAAVAPLPTRHRTLVGHNKFRWL